MTRLLFLLSVFTLSFTTAFAEVKLKTVTLDVPGMTCKFCPITIRKALKKVDGVNQVSAEYKTKTATVTFDPAKTNIKALTKATTDAGYPSTLQPPKK